MKSTRIILLITLALLFLTTSGVYAQGPESYTVGYFLWYSGNDFKDQMAELGYIEGQNITYLGVSFEGFDTMTPEEAMASWQQQIQDIIAAQPDILVTNTDTDAVNMSLTSGNIPIVFARSDDPLATGAVQDLVTPGLTMTGSVTNRPHERRLQLLTEILPSTDKVYYLYDPLNPDSDAVLAQVRAVGDSLGVEVVLAPIPGGAGGVAVLEDIPEGIDWFFLTPYVLADQEFLAQLVTVSEEQRIPIAGVMDIPTKGYELGYGPSIAATDAEAARIVDRIFRGANPAELPVQIAENVLTINLEAAEAINMDIPVEILRQAELIVRPGYFDSLGQ